MLTNLGGGGSSLVSLCTEGSSFLSSTLTCVASFVVEMSNSSGFAVWLFNERERFLFFFPHKNESIAISATMKAKMNVPDSNELRRRFSPIGKFLMIARNRQRKSLTWWNRMSQEPCVVCGMYEFLFRKTRITRSENCFTGLCFLIMLKKLLELWDGRVDNKLGIIYFFNIVVLLNKIVHKNYYNGIQV
ncbi:hypothetical protein Hanom_Chr04g00322581 [Helianthus anomalus]